MFAAVRINGKFVRSRIAANETEEQAMNRVWWIAEHAVDKPVAERDALSHMHVNVKYNGMSYDDK